MQARPKIIVEQKQESDCIFGRMVRINKHGKALTEKFDEFSVKEFIE